MRRAENKTHSGKWARKDEFVPTGQSPATRVFEVQWYDLCAGFLREQNDPAAGSIYGTARTIRGDDDIVTRCDDVGQMQHSGRAFARAGAADDREAARRPCPRLRLHFSDRYKRRGWRVARSRQLRSK